MKSLLFLQVPTLFTRNKNDTKTYAKVVQNKIDELDTLIVLLIALIFHTLLVQIYWV